MGRFAWLGSVLGALLWMGCGIARADAVLLMEEPINLLGHVTSTGHAALLMERLCSDDALTMRECGVGEAGAVISRYNGIGRYDWLAVAPVPYFFAVERLDEAPLREDWAGLAALRESYRVGHLMALAPQGGDGPWIQLVGASYRRRIICVRLHTTEEQDVRLMHWLNDRRNVSHFNLFYENCADFTRAMLNVLFPGSVHRNFWFDAEMTTPKQLASSLHKYAKHHKEVGFAVSVIPQVPGTISRSGHMYGVTQSFVWTKPYLLGFGVLEPVGFGTVLASALLDRRYDVHRGLGKVPVLQASDGTLGAALGIGGVAEQRPLEAAIFSAWIDRF